MSQKENHTDASQEILDAFKAMWDLHPAPVMMIRADRSIVDINQTAKDMGITTGIKCFQLTGNHGICEGCKGNEALKKGTAMRAGAFSTKLDMFLDTYWIPVRGADGLYIHFSNNITQWVKDELCGHQA